jgi:hypothetical protein
MKVGKHTDIVALATEIQRRANAKKDLVVNTKNLKMSSGRDERPDEVLLQVADLSAVHVNSIAHDQIGTHCDIPAKYYDKMLTQAPDLLANNVNRWFTKFPTPRMVRALDGTARAFLSDKYRPLENEDLAEACLPPIMELGLTIMSAEITERKLYIKAVDPRVQRELDAKGGKFGDGMHNIVRMLAPAITISNSEVGMGALSILGGVYDGFCSNLATFGERSVRKYHVGAKHEIGGEQLYAMLSDNTRKLTDKATWAQVGDVVRAAFDRARFDALCDKIAETEKQEITGDVVKVVELAGRKFGFNDTENKSILDHLIKGGSLTRYGYYNAVTRTAQDNNLSYDRASELERVGGNIIELPASEWKIVAEAA